MIYKGCHNQLRMRVSFKKKTNETIGLGKSLVRLFKSTPRDITGNTRRNSSTPRGEVTQLYRELFSGSIARWSATSLCKIHDGTKGTRWKFIVLREQLWSLWIMNEAFNDDNEKLFHNCVRFDARILNVVKFNVNRKYF